MPIACIIPRDGQSPFVFDGSRLAHSTGARHEGKPQSRYFNLALYCAENGPYVAHWHYVSAVEFVEHHATESFTSLVSAMTAVEVFDCLTWFRGALIGPHFKLRRKKWQLELKLRYARQVYDLWCQLDDFDSDSPGATVPQFLA